MDYHKVNLTTGVRGQISIGRPCEEVAMLVLEVSARNGSLKQNLPLVTFIAYLTQSNLACFLLLRPLH